jgi:hypothetical protein
MLLLWKSLTFGRGSLYADSSYFYFYSFFLYVQKGWQGTTGTRCSSCRDCSGYTAFDSTVYIGPISYFADTKEFHTPLYYSEEVKIDESYDYLTKSADSLIYAQNGVSRKRLPYETAQWFFKIGGMASISLFSIENNKVGEARLVRNELYNDANGDQFIAVYKATGSDDLSKKAVYCASAFEDRS